MKSTESSASDCPIDNRERKKQVGMIDTRLHGKQPSTNILLELFNFHLGHFRNSSKKPLNCQLTQKILDKLKEDYVEEPKLSEDLKGEKSIMKDNKSNKNMIQLVNLINEKLENINKINEIMYSKKLKTKV